MSNENLTRRMAGVLRAIWERPIKIDEIQQLSNVQIRWLLERRLLVREGNLIYCTEEGARILNFYSESRFIPRKQPGSISRTVRNLLQVVQIRKGRSRAA